MLRHARLYRCQFLDFLAGRHPGHFDGVADRVGRALLATGASLGIGHQYKLRDNVLQVIFIENGTRFRR